MGRILTEDAHDCNVRSVREFPDYPPLLRYCVSLGRRLQDPLQEIAGVAAAGPADLAMLKLHPLQGVVDRALLVSRLERALVSVVSEVGVDVNAAVRYEHLAAALAYVPGLGVRKAQGLRQQLQALRSAKGRRKNDDADDADAESGGNAKNLPPLPRGLPNRQTLIDYKILGPQVYMNAAPFLRIPVAQFMSRCVPCRFSVVTEGSSDAVGPVVG